MSRKHKYFSRSTSKLCSSTTLELMYLVVVEKTNVLLSIVHVLLLRVISGLFVCVLGVRGRTCENKYAAVTHTFPHLSRTL